jgi:hypothetical protein
MTGPAVNPRPQDFKWASDKAANLREPITALKEKGWQYADIPTASNFNWLVSELAKWDKYLEGRVNGTADDLSQLFNQVRYELKEIREYLKTIITVLSSVRDRVVQHHPQPPLLLPRLPDIREVDHD